MRITKPLVLVLIVAVLANLSVLAFSSGLVDRVIRVAGRWLPEPALPPTIVEESDLRLVRSHLPASSSDVGECRFSLGDWTPDVPMQLSHQEGAVVRTPTGYAMLSGFSHYVSNVLMGTSRVDLLETSSSQWQVVGVPAPTIVSHVQGATIGDDGWIAGGFIGQHPGKASRQTWRYSVVDHSWTEGPLLPTARASGALAALGDSLHYVGGLEPDRQTDLAEHLILDTNLHDGQWRAAASFPRARNHFQVVSFEGLLFAVGGQHGHDKSVRDLPWLDVYLPSENRWIPLQDMPQGRSHAEMATFVHGEHIFMAGGRTAENSEVPEQSIIAYDIRADRWLHVGELPVPLISPFARVIDQHLYVAGGGLNWNRPQRQAWRASLSTVCNRQDS